MDTKKVEGLNLTNGILEVLKRWQNSASKNVKSDPERYLDYLSDIQDGLIRVMLEKGSDIQDIADLLTKSICIKDDIREFIIEE